MQHMADVQPAAPDLSLQIVESTYRANTTKETTFNSLPQEHVDAIIDEIHNDSDLGTARRTLKSCALVSRIFVRRTRKHLFGHLSIRSIRECQRFLACPQVHSFTTSLTIIFQRRYPNDEGYPIMPTLTALPSLVDALHNVNTIKLCGMDWKSLSQRFVDSLASRSFASVTLILTRFPDSKALYSFLSHSPNLRQFSCFGTTIDNGDNSPFSASFDASHRPRITELRLRKMNQIPDMLLSPALSSVNLQSLRILEVVIDGIGEFDQARRLMNLTVHSLEVLRVSYLMKRPADPSDYLPIERLQKLQSIIIDIRLYGLGIFQWWIEHFERYPTMQCSCVHLFVVDTLADGADWKRLDTALSRTSIRSLVVTVFMTSASTQSMIKSAIEKNLPILMSCQIARVQPAMHNFHVLVGNFNTD
ncbi:uncharacterized protein EV420DRAFT_605840 [Desarmillaria tabescens]|uniref:Uncharacterized protein n=1 Tax=Armillaria tabescens TaxID=1929756 RepID=A0AA39K4J7_ARMTA|nr:uncharacterized protein EV420DRAFT_605840 [Desarmillaria tabescens]KAK0454223.1 hypothetical protein EV420DRAFT_605840 [Desarmillaria tabescens]